VKFVDLHLSEVAQMVNYGFFGEIDVAVIEASAIAPDGRVWLTSGIGNAPTWLLRAKKVIIELNHYHSPRVAELADIVIPGAPPRRNSIAIFHTMDRVGSRYVQIDPKKIVAVVETELPDAGNVLDKIIRFVRKLPITWSPFCWKRWLADASRLNFCRCKAAWAISTTRSWRGWAKIRISRFYDVLGSFTGVGGSSAGNGKITGVSASSLTISADSLRKIYDNMDFFASHCPAPAGDLQSSGNYPPSGGYRPQRGAGV
jgi:hypothetical protein